MLQREEIVFSTNMVGTDKSDKAKSPEGHVLDHRDSSKTK